MKCIRCRSIRILTVFAHCSDSFNAHGMRIDYQGYVPAGIGVGEYSGDDVEFTYCLDCGQIQGEFPLPLTRLEKERDLADELKR